jgi:hypothetical protein
VSDATKITRLDAYRSSCANCTKLEAELAELAAILDGGLRPYQVKEPRCPFCNAKLFRVSSTGGSDRKAWADDRYCPGSRLLAWCRRVRVPHVHRKCAWCGARWLESPAHLSLRGA